MRAASGDTSYRVFDGNRVGLDGQPRAFPIQEVLRSIDFTSIVPTCLSAAQHQLSDVSTDAEWLEIRIPGWLAR